MLHESFIKNNKVLLADGQAIEWQSGSDTPLKVLTRNNKLLLADGKHSEI
nr:MAG TPA: hypothetical protein [Caudoviricetes sp.]